MTSIIFSVYDRNILIDAMPVQGTRLQMTLKRHLVAALDFSPQEIEDLKMATLPDGATIWQREKEFTKVVEVSNDQLILLKQMADKMAQSDRIDDQMLTLIEKIEGAPLPE